MDVTCNIKKFPSLLCNFIDEHSHFTWISFLKPKNIIAQAFLQFKTNVELQLGHKIKVLQSDWGGEFQELTSILLSVTLTRTKWTSW